MFQIEELKKLGAGDKQCVECLLIAPSSMDACRQCIKETPGFTAAIKQFVNIQPPKGE